MENDDTISLQDYLAVLRRQRWIMVLVPVFVVSAALGFSFAQTPQYEADTELVVDPLRRSTDVSALEDLLSPQGGVVETERLVLTSRPVADRVAASLGIDDMRPVLDRLRVEAVSDTRVLRIVMTDPDPARAAAITDAFAESYLDYRRDQALDEILAAQASIEERASGLRDQIAQLGEEIADLPRADDARAELEIQRDGLIAQLGQVLANTDDGEGDQTDAVTGGGAILTPADIATSPVSPQPIRTGALAVVLGLLLAVGLAFLRDHIDDVVREESDFKRVTGNRPILGRIPTWKAPKGDEERLATIVEPASLASESYRELSAGVRFLLVASQDRDAVAAQAADPTWRDRGSAVMICSASAGEGKSSTASNLAVAAARVGLRTLLVDADLRRATVAKRFGVGKTTGLSDVLLHGDPVADHLVAVGVPNLLLLPAGTLPPNPAELLASPAMRALQRELLAGADLVIYDSPAVLAVPDALELGRFVDLTVLVARAGVTTRRTLGSAIERLTQVGTDIAGTVLNDIDAKSDGYYYSYYYTEAPVDEEGRKGRKKDRGTGAKGGTSGGPVADLTRLESEGSDLAPRPRMSTAEPPSGPASGVQPSAAEASGVRTISEEEARAGRDATSGSDSASAEAPKLATPPSFAPTSPSESGTTSPPDEDADADADVDGPSGEIDDADLVTDTETTGPMRAVRLDEDGNPVPVDGASNGSSSDDGDATDRDDEELFGSFYGRSTRR